MADSNDPPARKKMLRRARGSFILLQRSETYLSRRRCTVDGWKLVKDVSKATKKLKKNKKKTAGKKPKLNKFTDFRPPPIQSFPPQPEDEDRALVESPRHAIAPSQAADLLSEIERNAPRRTQSYYKKTDLAEESYYTDDAVRERAKLRFHPEVLFEATRFFHLVAKGSCSIGKTKYIAFNMALQRALFDDFDPVKGRFTAEKDWVHDCSGLHNGNRLEREDFIDGLFELADLWTDVIDGEAYAKFLRNLYERVSRQDQQQKQQRKMIKDIGGGRSWSRSMR